jgi:hypothetical protein
MSENQPAVVAPVEPPVRRVVCAAVRSDDGDVLVGVRHYSPDMHAQIHARRDGAKFCHRFDDDQGFVDQRGAYMTREEAHAVATQRGQIVRRCAGDETRLFSENLY